MPAIDWTFLAGINLLQVAIVILALYVTVKLLVRFWPWLRKVMNFTAALSQLPAFILRTDQTLLEQSQTLTAQSATLTAQDSKIADIHHEVHYNNGSSVKDAVNRVELGVKGIYDRLDAADVDRRELREDLEQTKPHAPARKRAPKPKE